MEKNIKSGFNKRYIGVIILLVLVMYVVLPQFGSFRSSLHILAHPSVNWTLLAILLSLGTYAAGAVTYWLLAFKRLSYYKTVLVQLAAMFVNRLLPAGVGALGVNYLYLRHERHSNAQAASVVTLNNVLGSIGHTIILLITLALVGGKSSSLMSDTQLSGWWKNIGLLALVLIALVMVAFFARGKVKKFLVDFKTQLLTYRKRPSKLLLAQLTSILLTLCNVLAFAFCAVALGVSFDFVALFLIFTFGVALGAATPTPGGLGGFEAGLAAGLIANGVGEPTALAVALLYRLVSYWLPLVIGGVSFVFVQRGGTLATE